MRTRRQRIFRLLELDPASDFAAGQVEFRHLRRVPQAAPGAPAVAGGHAGIWERRWNQIAGAEIESLQYFPGRRIEKDYVVGEIICNQQFVVARICNYGDACGIWNRHMRRRRETCRELFARRERLQRDGNKSLRRNLTFGKTIDCDSVSCAAGCRAGGVA